MINLEVYTVGGIDFLASVFRALVLFLGGGPIESFVKLFVLFSAITFVLIAIFGRDKVIFLKQFPLVIFLLNLTFAPIVNLTIIDTKTGRTEVVQNFPFIPGFLISLMSNTSSDFLVSAIDNLFHTGLTISIGGGVGASITDLDYRSVGFAGVANISKRVLDYDFKNTPEYFEFYNKLLAYLDQCFLPYIATLNDTEKKRILTSGNLFDDMRVQGFLMEHGGKTYTCNEFYDNILSPAYQNLITDLQNNPEKAGFDLTESVLVPSHIAYLTNLSYTFASAVAQAGIINSLRYAILVKMSDNSGILGAYIAGRTAEQNKVLWRGLGIYASEMLPKLRDYLVAIAVFFSFLLIPMILLPFFGGTAAMVLIGYARYIMWVYLWDPLLALTDAGLKIWAIHKSQTFVNSMQIFGITFATQTQIADNLDWYPAIGGYIAGVMVPSLAWMFVRGFEMGVSAVAYMFSGTQQQISKELQEMNRNITREYANVKLGDTFRNAGELMSSIEQVSAYREASMAKAYKDLIDRYGIEDVMKSFEVPVRRSFGESIGHLRAARQLEMSVEGLRAFQTHISEVKQFLENKAFNRYLLTLGADSYVKTRLYELYNESAKMGNIENTAKLLGYATFDWDRDGKLTAKDYYEGIYRFMLDKHRTNNEFVINPENKIYLAQILEGAGYKDIAQELREGKYEGAKVRLSYWQDEQGNVHLGTLEIRKGTDIETFDIQRDSFIREFTYRNKSELDTVSLIQAAHDDKAKSRLILDITSFIEKGINSGMSIEQIKEALIDKFGKELSMVYQNTRQINQGVEANVRVGISGGDFVPKLKNLKETKEIIKNVADKLNISHGNVKAEGGSTDTINIDKQKLEVAKYVEKLEMDMLLNKMLLDNKITPDEIGLLAKFVERDLINPLIDDKIKHAENLAYGDKTVQAIENTKEQVVESAKSIAQNYQTEALVIAAALFGNEIIDMVSKGAKVLSDVISKIKGKPPGEPPKSLPKSLPGNRSPYTLGDRTDRIKAILEEAKKHGDEVYEATKELIEDVDKTMKRMPKEGIGPLDILEIGKHVIEEKLGKIATKYGREVAEKVGNVFKTGLKGLPIIGTGVGILMDGEAYASTLDTRNVVEFEGNYYEIQEKAFKYGLIVENGRLEVKDLQKFEPLAQKLGLDPLTDYPAGKLSPEAEAKIIQRFGMPWEPGLIPSPFLF